MKPPTARGMANVRMSMLTVRRALTTRAEFVDEINRLVDQGLETMVDAGRRLVEAREALPHGDYEAMVREDLEIDPSTAYRLRTVAEFVDSGVVAREDLPGHYTKIFLLATLTPEQLETARERGLLKPRVTKRQLEDFKRKCAGRGAPSLPFLDVAGVPPAPVLVPDERPSPVVRDERPPAAIHTSAVAPTPADQWHVPMGAESPALTAGTELPLPPAPTAAPTPPTIDVEAVHVVTEPAVTAGSADKPAGVDLPPPLVTARLPPVSVFAEAMDRPWLLAKEDPGVVLVDLGRAGRHTLIVVDPDRSTIEDDVTAAAIAEYIVDLHNARLMKAVPT